MCFLCSFWLEGREPTLTSNAGGPLANGADSFRFFNSAAAEPGIGSSRKKLSTAAGFGFAFSASGFFLTTAGAGGESTAVVPVEVLSLGDAFAAAFLVGEVILLCCSSSVSKSL